MTEKEGSTARTRSPSWIEARMFQHAMLRGALPDPHNLARLPADKWFDRIDERYRDRARYFHAFGPAFAQLGAMPGELRLSFEPLHPLNLHDLRAFISAEIESLGLPDPDEGHGLTAVSRALLAAYNPAADLFPDLVGVPESKDLFLYDAITGFLLWSDGKRVRNTWLGNIRDQVDLANQPEPLYSLLIQSPADYFRIGTSVFTRLVGPRLRRRQFMTFDSSDIPTITVETQRDLEELAGDIRSACDSAPAKIKAMFRGQTSEYHVPQRTKLAAAGICPYSDLTDHSAVPSLYRNHERFQEKLEDFRGFANNLLDWGLYADVIFGDPAAYFTIDGRPYVPKEADAKYQATVEYAFSGESSGNRTTDDMGPYTIWTIKNPDGTIFDQYVKRFRPGHTTVRRHLLLQHYGAPTSFIDVTDDIRVAEWFALHRIDVDRRGLAITGRVSAPFERSVIYVLFALEGLTPLVTTHDLVTSEEALRPHRQSCALIGGAGNLYRNAISRFIGLKIKLASTFVPVGVPTAEHLFPGPDEDRALKKLDELYKSSDESARLFPVYQLTTQK